MVTALRLEPFTGKRGTPEHEAWKAQCLVLNKRASARFARWQNRIGRPVPKSWEDRAPDPGLYDDDPEGDE